MTGAIAAIFVMLAASGATDAAAQLRSVELRHNDSETLRLMQKFGRCVARAKPRAVAAVLERDPSDPAYHDVLRRMSQERWTCLPPRGIMVFNNLAVAGAMAEWMVLHDHPEDRLSRIVAQPPARTDLERFSLCAVRAAPMRTLAVLRADIGSTAEIDAMKAMSDDFIGCVGPAGAVRFSKPTLRSGLALAAYHLTTPAAGTN